MPGRGRAVHPRGPWLPKTEGRTGQEARKNGNLVQSLALTTGQCSAPGKSGDKYRVRPRRERQPTPGRHSPEQLARTLPRVSVTGKNLDLKRQKRNATMRRRRLDRVLVQK